MTEEVLKILRCTVCGDHLQRDRDEVFCARSHRYPVVDGVPRLVAEARLSPRQQRTADAFAYAWTRYPKENPYTEQQWADWILPLTSADFEGRLVLDAGCGLGGFAEYAAGWGADRVVGIDLSDAVFAARRRVGERVDVIQADLHRPPFAPGTFDLAYSIGVLHHLEDPEAGFAAVAAMVRPGGMVFAWVYGRENNGWIVTLVDPVRKHLLPRLPRLVLKWGVAWPAAALLWPLVRLATRRPRLPYRPYLRWLSERDFAFLHGVVFDHLVAPTSHYVRRDEFAAWFERAGLEDVQITWRNRNSWRGLGRLPERVAAPPAVAVGVLLREG